jgi:hypothetical protein
MSWLSLEKEYFLGYGFEILNEDRKQSDLGTLIASVNPTKPPFHEVATGTRMVAIKYTKPTETISLPYGPWNQATHEGTTFMLDRLLTDFKINLPIHDSDEVGTGEADEQVEEKMRARPEEKKVGGEPAAPNPLRDKLLITGDARYLDHPYQSE